MKNKTLILFSKNGDTCIFSIPNIERVRFMKDNCILVQCISGYTEEFELPDESSVREVMEMFGWEE